MCTDRTFSIDFVRRGLLVIFVLFFFFFSLQELLQLYDCSSMLDLLKWIWQDGIFQTPRPSSTGVFFFFLCSFPFKQSHVVPGSLST